MAVFERFSDDARNVVIDAQHEARRLHHGWIGCEHLLHAVTRQNADVAVTLRAHGITSATVGEAILDVIGKGVSDAAALATIGIDLDQVRAQVETTFGPGALDRAVTTRRRLIRRRRTTRCTGTAASHSDTGALPFTPRAKRCLEIAATSARTHLIAADDVAVALLARSDTAAAQVLAHLGVDIAALHADLMARRA